MNPLQFSAIHFCPFQEKKKRKKVARALTVFGKEVIRLMISKIRSFFLSSIFFFS